VTEVTDGLAVERRHVYVLPPNYDMTIRDGILRLSARTLTHGQHRPIDHFFVSMAEDCGDRSIAVILSGTASDGTSAARQSKRSVAYARPGRGNRKIRQHAQERRGSRLRRFRSASQSHSRRARQDRKASVHHARSPAPDQLLGPAAPSDIHALFAMLRENKGVDFTHYKQSTLQRRIKRRMVLNRVESLQDYLRTGQARPQGD